MRILLPRDHAENPLLQRVSDIRATSQIHISKNHVLEMNRLDCSALFRYLQIRELADEEILHDLDVFFE